MSKSNTKTYEVFSRPYNYKVEGKTVYTAVDYCLIKARVKSEAKIMAMRIFRDPQFTRKQYGLRHGSKARFLREHKNDNPFRMMKIVDVTNL